ncbi:major facilitator superfamily transporter [Pseudomassariella vexata]|uniref:Major facilitator superfamily transporter n=1 Tax=Pseudomassariella vexata TaxID=1141098 RepID=A0A1Y2EDT1_9PEZI|nr:major facilitator superfamily transporter [Pseudomassariella vexata]ORY69732.1 major facilitator superfamily transporter [Pseudomassariella vexata]
MHFTMTRDTISRFLPFSPSTTPLQAGTYLCCISLFSISFLVFLNSAVSFVITDLIGIKTNVGDIVGTLGFVDEIVALVACPVWGLVSDRLGVRWVAVLGYAVIGLALFVFVQARAVWPSLVLARILFAVGATAAATMVTAILPVLTDDGEEDTRDDDDGTASKPNSSQRNSVAMSTESDATITPDRFPRTMSNGGRLPEDVEDTGSTNKPENTGKKPSALAGLVGLFTGCGALVALVLFLPLPAQFSKRQGVTLAQSVTYSFYVVGSISFLVAVFVYFGLAGLKGEDGKGWRMLLSLEKKEPYDSGLDATSSSTRVKPFKPLPYHQLLLSSLRLGTTDPHIALGYLGGFVARASTVAISLFIPLYVNAFFIGNGFCQGSPNDPSPELKKECRAAYILASILTGVAQMVALLCAPVFGYLSTKRWRGVNLPVLMATLSGVVGYALFPRLQSPEYKNVNGRGGSGAIFFVVALLGISQIGAIVCSLGSLGRGVLTVDQPAQSSAPSARQDDGEAAPLLENGHAAPVNDGSRVQLKGSIAGVYSWCGGAAILLLTKLGGYLFDATSRGAPFYMMAMFNAILLLASLGIDLGRGIRARSAS